MNRGLDVKRPGDQSPESYGVQLDASREERDVLRVVAGMLEGETVIVTGATGGIGTSVSRMVAAAGARLALTDLRVEDVNTLAGELGCVGDSADVASPGAFEHLHAWVEGQIGPVTAIVNCAGMWSPLSYDEIDSESWSQTLAANLGTTFIACQTVLPGMISRGKGSIVNFASTAGEYGSISPATHYAAAKGGVIALTKSLAREASPHGVRVNAVSPGPVQTDALGVSTAAAIEAAAARTLFNRLGQPYEIASVCVFLISVLSTFVTGTVLQVNGGSLL